MLVWYSAIRSLLQRRWLRTRYNLFN